MKIKSFSLEFLLVNPCRVENEEEVKTGNFTYIGTESTYPTLELDVTRACNKVKIEFQNKITSGFMELNTSFNQGEKIVIDWKKKSINVNGKDSMPILSIDSDFPTVEKGFNKFNLIVGNVTFKIKYFNLYR